MTLLKVTHMNFLGFCIIVSGDLLFIYLFFQTRAAIERPWPTFILSCSNAVKNHESHCQIRKYFHTLHAGAVYVSHLCRWSDGPLFFVSSLAIRRKLKPPGGKLHCTPDCRQTWRGLTLPQSELIKVSATWGRESNYNLL